MTKPAAVQYIQDKVRSFGFKQWFLLTLNVVLVLCSIAALAGKSRVADTLDALDGAERFKGDSDIRFAQEACFMPVGQGKTEEDIWSFRQALDGKLVEESMEAPENGKLYLDAYSGTSQVELAAGKRTASVKAIGVGGEFFFFHPLKLLSGSYLSERDIMDDLVLLDEEMAWRLFGSPDLVGMELTINGQPFVVGGVISREDDFATKKAFTEEGGIFMSYSAMQRLDENAQISCYEIVMPDPISGYAKNMMTEIFQTNGGDVVENSHRYGTFRLLGLVKEFGTRSMRTNGVIYPYWENAARLTEDYAALLLILAILTALCPLTFALVILVRLVIVTYRKAKTKIPEKVESAVERRREEKLERKYEKKAKGE